MRISDWSSDVCSSDLPSALRSLLQFPVPTCGHPRQSAPSRAAVRHGRFRVETGAKRSLRAPCCAGFGLSEEGLAITTVSLVGRSERAMKSDAWVHGMTAGRAAGCRAGAADVAITVPPDCSSGAIRKEEHRPENKTLQRNSYAVL